MPIRQLLRTGPPGGSSRSPWPRVVQSATVNAASTPATAVTIATGRTGAPRIR